MEKFNCIIVDDDEVAMLKVVSIARKFSVLNIVGSFTSADVALSVIEKEKIDVLFLDIDMPDMNGLEFRKKMMTVPVNVYITSHAEHAIESFELDTLDFIVKPLRFERFEQTIKRIEEFMEIRRKAAMFEISSADDFIYIKDGYDKIKVKLYEVMYLEALKDYTILVTDHKRYCVLYSIGNLIKESNFQSFVRVHRSFAVRKNFVKIVGTQQITLINNTSIPIGNSYKANIEAVL